MDTVKKTLVGTAITAAAFASMATGVLADKGGVPNDNSCLGQATSAYARANGGAGPAVREQAQNDVGPGRSAEVQAFKAANCPADSSTP